MAATFLCSISGGMLIVLGISPVHLIARRFIRLIGAIALALAAGVAVWSVLHGAFDGQALRAVAAAFSLGGTGGAAVVIMSAQAPPSKSIILKTAALTGGVCGVVAACSWALVSTGVTETWETVLVQVVGQCLGTLLLGSVTVAWLLGHAYLTASKMSLAPLKMLSRLFSLSVGLRIGYLIGSMLLIKYGWVAGGNDAPVTRLMGSWLILCLRIGVGLIAVGLFAYMVADCVKIRSTQSATGILYFASVFTYIGELSSQYLAGQLGLPL